MGPFAKTHNIYGAGGGRSAWSHFGAANIRTSPEKTGITIKENGGKETRPINAAVHWIIKFRSR
jgi:hypothetical protein